MRGRLRGRGKRPPRAGGGGGPGKVVLRLLRGERGCGPCPGGGAARGCVRGREPRGARAPPLPSGTRSAGSPLRCGTPGPSPSAGGNPRRSAVRLCRERSGREWGAEQPSGVRAGGRAGEAPRAVRTAGLGSVGVPSAPAVRSARSRASPAALRVPSAAAPCAGAGGG